MQQYATLTETGAALNIYKPSPVQLLDLFKSLVVLWIVNTVNELIHLRHIIHQNPLYVGLPICP